MPPTHTPHPLKKQTGDGPEAQAKGGPCWQDDEIHAQHFQTHQSPVTTVSSKPECQNHCAFTLHSVWHQPKGSGGPPMQHRPQKNSCLVGQMGNLVSISPFLSKIKIPGIPELPSC